MIWKAIRASVIGTSHLENNTACQDNCWVDTVHTKDSGDCLVAIVSDGAGSALKGGIGSELVCVTILNSIATSLKENGTTSLNEDSVIEWVKDARREIYSEAYENNLTAREYACTLLCSVVTNESAIFFQIGDGAIIVSKSNILGVVFWPDSGEYANSTYFVTDENALDHLRVTKSNSRIDELALFSDGLQHLALSYESMTAHFPFFDPMFHIIQTRNNANCDDLDQQLEGFLNSDAINLRTDDDKTLILATRKQT